MGKIHVVVGGQFGSEGKGAVCAWLARQHPGSMSARVGGPNAGHTAYDHEGRKWVLQQVPMAAIADPTANLVIAAGSEVDLQILDREIVALDEAGFKVSNRLFIDQSATLMTPSHSEQETLGQPHGAAGLTASIGSTGKGIGAARAERIWRKAFTMRGIADGQGTYTVHSTNAIHRPVPITDTGEMLRNTYSFSKYPVIIEGTQGYGLGLHTSYYPYTTSGDCRAIDALAAAGISPWDISPEVWCVFRTFPIRVAGNSGPLYRETTWEALGQPEEKTTVTKKRRRVGEWDASLAAEALEANGAYAGAGNSRVALLFLDYVFPELANCDDAGRVEEVAIRYLDDRETELDHRIDIVGTGPATIVDMRKVR